MPHQGLQSSRVGRIAVDVRWIKELRYLLKFELQANPIRVPQRNGAIEAGSITNVAARARAVDLHA